MLCRVLCALVFVAWTGEAPLSLDPVLYYGLWRSPFQIFGPLFVPLPALHLFTLQVLLLFIAPLCLLKPGAFRKRTFPMYAAIAASFATLVVTFLWGLVRGGSAYLSYYQLWRFLAALLVGALLLAVVHTSRDLKAVGLTVLSAALVRGTLAIYFYCAYVKGRNLQPVPAHMTTHEDSLLFVAGIVVAAAWALARMTWTAQLTAFVVAAHLMVALAVNNRRIAWIELSFALATLYLLLPRRGLRRRVNRRLVLATPVLLVYALVGWGRPEPVFAPLKAFATTGSDADGSSLARLEEDKNLVYTLFTAGNPLLGTGWGHPYLERTNIYSRYIKDWTLYRVLPHNSLLGLAAFGGVVGLFGFWLVVPIAALVGTRGLRDAKLPVDRAAAMAAVSLLPAYGAQCFGDVGLQMLTCNMVLSIAIGACGSVFARTGPPPAPSLARALARRIGARPASLRPSSTTGLASRQELGS